MQSRGKEFLKSILLLTLVSVVMLLICEAAVRFIYGESTSLTPRYHTSSTYGDVTLRRIRSNMSFTHKTPDGSWKFKTNEQGFRNYEDFAYEKPVDTVRIVAIGDSHTQGYECQQEYTYSATIERYLKNKGVNAQVMNTGVSGFSTAEALLLLEHDLVNYSPDFVVLGFFANDFEDNLKSGLFSLDDQGELIQQKTEHIPGVMIQDFIYAIPGVQWLGENSYFYSVLFNFTWDHFKALLARTARKQIPTELAVPTRNNSSEYELRLAAQLIRRIHKTADRIGAQFIFLDIPRAVEKNNTAPSVTEELLVKLSDDFDYFVSSKTLNRYQGVAPFHVPNGGRHITEFTHTILGTEVAEYIWRTIEGDDTNIDD